MEKVVELDFLDLLYVKFSNLNFIYKVKKFQLFVGTSFKERSLVNLFPCIRFSWQTLHFARKTVYFFNFQNILSAIFFFVSNVLFLLVDVTIFRQ